MRKVEGDKPKSLGESSFIVSKKDPRFSCSFVEFDGRGDFIDFKQHEDCYKQIREMLRRNQFY